MRADDFYVYMWQGLIKVKKKPLARLTNTIGHSTTLWSLPNQNSLTSCEPPLACSESPSACDSQVPTTHAHGSPNENLTSFEPPLACSLQHSQVPAYHHNTEIWGFCCCLDCVAWLRSLKTASRGCEIFQLRLCRTSLPAAEILQVACCHCCRPHSRVGAT